MLCALYKLGKERDGIDSALIVVPTKELEEQYTAAMANHDIHFSNVQVAYEADFSCYLPRDIIIVDEADEVLETWAIAFKDLKIQGAGALHKQSFFMMSATFSELHKKVITQALDVMDDCWA